MKQMEAEQDWFYYLAFIRATEVALFLQYDHEKYKTSDRTIDVFNVYNVDKDDFEKINYEDAINNNTFWDENGNSK